MQETEVELNERIAKLKADLSASVARGDALSSQVTKLGDDSGAVRKIFRHVFVIISNSDRTAYWTRNNFYFILF
jgi:cell division protein FtsB